MTIIVYRAGSLVADTATWQNGIISGHAVKVRKHPNGYLSAGSGRVSACEAFHAWVADFRDERTRPVAGPPEDFQGILVSPQGEALLCDGSWFPYAIEADFFAIGSCEEFARGLLVAGCSAYDAVALCIQHCAWVGGSACGETI